MDLDGGAIWAGNLWIWIWMDLDGFEVIWSDLVCIVCMDVLDR